MNLVIIGTILFNIRLVFSKTVNVDEYCKLKCIKPGVNHTICHYKCEVSPACLNYREYEMNNKDRQYILDLHNFLRNYVASGQDQRGGNGAAKNMAVLNYDIDIEVTTSCWGKRCLFEHDQCRQHPKYKSAGQNLFQRSSSADINAKDIKLLNASVIEWYDEIKDTTKELIVKFDVHPVPKVKIGHYTQVAWASTEQLGCSRVTYEDKSDPTFNHNYHLLCNYSPAGNILGQPVYEFGSGCTSKKPNKEYPSLCGDLKILSDDREKNPAGDVDALKNKNDDKKKSEKDKDPNVPANAFQLYMNVVTLCIFYVLLSKVTSYLIKL